MFNILLKYKTKTKNNTHSSSCFDYFFNNNFIIFGKENRCGILEICEIPYKLQTGGRVKKKN